MPKLKTKSAVKKRFSVTAKGKLKVTQAGKRHFMITKSSSTCRNLRGTTILGGKDAKNISKYYLPYGNH